MFRSLSKRAFNTFKSKNDEQANQALMQRLRQVPPLVPTRTILEKPEDIKNDTEHLSLDQLSRLVKLNLMDALTWNASILGRIYMINEEDCQHIVNYVKPMVLFVDSTQERPMKLVDTSVVIDVARLKFDKNYLPDYQSLVFSDNKQRFEVLSTEKILVQK